MGRPASFGVVLQGYFPGSEQNLFKEFIEWRHEVDCEYLLDTFDLALGWFSGKGLSHERACVLAGKLNDIVLSGKYEEQETDRPYNLGFDE